MSGLLLARTVRHIDEPAIVTEARSGVSEGDLHRLALAGRRVVGQRVTEIAIEPGEETAAPEGGGRLRRWDARELEDGVYMAHSVGRDAVDQITYFEIIGGEVRRDFGHDRRRAARELRRLH